MFRRTSVGVAVRATFGGIAGVLAFSGMPAHAQTQQSLERVEITGSLLRRIEGEAALAGDDDFDSTSCARPARRTPSRRCAWSRRGVPR